MSHQYPVSIDQEILLQYREELEGAIQELEALVIQLERTPDDLAVVEQIRLIIQDTWMNSVKLDLAPVSESLADLLKGFQRLLAWQIYPPSMTEYLLILLDRLMDIASEAETKHYIDMRKTQTILISLQPIILAQSPEEIATGIEQALNHFTVPHRDSTQSTEGAEEILLFDDDDTLSQSGDEVDSDNPTHDIDIFIPQQILNPLLQARDFIQAQAANQTLTLLADISDKVMPHEGPHTQLLLELALTCNLLAGRPVACEDIYQGICLHDVSLVTLTDILSKRGQLSRDEQDDLNMHPIKSAEVARVLNLSSDAELLVLHHHERLDGSGFPYGLTQSGISEQGKLALIVDSFHAIIDAYPRLPERERVLRAIIEINRNMGRFYDPSWVRLFNTTLRDYWLPDWRARVRAAQTA